MHQNSRCKQTFFSDFPHELVSLPTLLSQCGVCYVNIASVDCQDCFPKSIAKLCYECDYRRHQSSQTSLLSHHLRRPFRHPNETTNHAGKCFIKKENI
jgi:hypothetical protein